VTVVTRQHASKSPRDRRRPSNASEQRRDLRTPQSPAPDSGYGIPVPEALHEAIQLERDNLSKVEALLACMGASMESQSSALRGPYYPLVVQIARELVDRSIDSLDPFVLKRRLLNKVKEGFGITVASQTYAHLQRLDSRPAFSASFAPCG
jgi:hypothetical protein